MVELNKDELAKLAKMSGLKLTDEESIEFVEQLRLLLDYTDEITQLTLGEEVEATRSINVFREDKVKAKDSKDIIENSPKHHGPYFSVPKILE